MVDGIGGTSNSHCSATPRSSADHPDEPPKRGTALLATLDSGEEGCRSVSDRRTSGMRTGGGKEETGEGETGRGG